MRRGGVTGVVKTRAEVHRDGDWHRSVFVWLLNSKQELLIQKRAPTKIINPNTWTSSASGHVKSGENSLTYAIKELREELGLDIPKEKFEYLGEARRSLKINHQYQVNEIDDVFLIQTDVAIENLKIQVSEIAAVQWINFRELERLIEQGDTRFAPQPEHYKKIFTTLHQRFG